VKRILLAAAVLASALVVVAVALGATTLKITSDKSGKLAYSKKTLIAKPGKVTIKMLNVQVLTHDIAIKKKKTSKKPIVKGKIVGKGKTSKVTATLKAGSYIFYCTVPGHEAGGMWGVLKIKK
jgi:plastocyanin